jgi:hypothetical protein
VLAFSELLVAVESQLTRLLNLLLNFVFTTASGNESIPCLDLLTPGKVFPDFRSPTDELPLFPSLHQTAFAQSALSKRSLSLGLVIICLGSLSRSLQIRNRTLLNPSSGQQRRLMINPRRTDTRVSQDLVQQANCLKFLVEFRLSRKPVARHLRKPTRRLRGSLCPDRHGAGYAKLHLPSLWGLLRGRRKPS